MSNKPAPNAKGSGVPKVPRTIARELHVELAPKINNLIKEAEALFTRIEPETKGTSQVLAALSRADAELRMVRTELVELAFDLPPAVGFDPKEIYFPDRVRGAR